MPVLVAIIWGISGDGAERLPIAIQHLRVKRVLKAKKMNQMSSKGLQNRNKAKLPTL